MLPPTPEFPISARPLPLLPAPPPTLEQEQGQAPTIITTPLCAGDQRRAMLRSAETAEESMLEESTTAWLGPFTTPPIRPRCPAMEFQRWPRLQPLPSLLLESERKHTQNQ